jgi:hypothetical protein
MLNRHGSYYRKDIQRVNSRQNPFNKVESFMQRIIEGPFALLFPTKLQPAQVARKLERAMEDTSLNQGDGRRLAPEIYDIYLSIKDHQQMQPVEASLKEAWKNQLIQFARQHNYFLRVDPVFRLHARANMRVGDVQIETMVADRASDAENGIMRTQSFTREEMERIRAAQQTGTGGFSTLGNPSQVDIPPQGQYGYAPPGGMPNNPASMPPPQAFAAPMPQAWLTIELRQAGVRKDYRIDKPVVKIGRQLDNDIIVEDKRVSRYHAQIRLEPDGQFIIYDLDSINGITVNGTPNQRLHMLQNGDRFTIGSYDFYFQRR